MTTEEAGDNIAEICHYGQRRFVSLGQTNGTLESIHFYATKIENEYQCIQYNDTMRKLRMYSSDVSVSFSLIEISFWNYFQKM